MNKPASAPAAVSTGLQRPARALFTLWVKQALLEAARGLGEAIKRADYAPGLPSTADLSSPTALRTDMLSPYVVQEHKARKLHWDLRLGADGQLHSWAVPKGLPTVGEKRLAVLQPVHRGSYANFEGVIGKGYGKGTVKTFDKGEVLVTKAEPNQVNFTVAHHKFPEHYSLVRTAKGPAQRNEPWLLLNTTPMDPVKFLQGQTPADVGLNKPKYTTVPARDVGKLFNGKYMAEAKLDGASAILALFGDRIEALSYRTSTTGRPLIHTQRIFGTSGVHRKVVVPKNLIGSLLRAEITGERRGAKIPPQELGGILNASLAKSLRAQQAKGIQLKLAPFDVVRKGRKIMADLPAVDRRKLLESFMRFLPKKYVELPEAATTPETMRALWSRISTGKHPQTSEGIVGWPTAGGRPTKVKVRPEADVWVTGVFPGEGARQGVQAGGFTYANKPGGETVGRVGSGFTAETLKDMLANPQDWVGRQARIISQGKFPSGAHRAPALITRHEDYSGTAPGKGQP